MGSLYRKALAIYEKTQAEGIEQGEPFSFDRVSGISVDEQFEIISQINEIAFKTRMEAAPEAFLFSFRRSGILLPVLINLLALVVILSGFYLSQQLFRRREESLFLSTPVLISAEGRLLEAARRESEAQISRKDREIADIQGRLTVLKGEREQLREQIEERFRLRHEELREDMARRLAAEQRRLEGEGLSAEDIEQKMSALEATLAKQNREQMDRLRNRMEAELAERQQAVNGLIEQQNVMIEQARLERIQLQRLYEEQEAALKSELEARQQKMEGEQQRLAGEYERFQEQRETEQLVNDTVLSAYRRVNDNLRESRYEEALAGLDGLESFLFQDSFTTIPAVMERRPVELFIIGSLKKLIENQRQIDSLDTESLIASASLLGSVSTIVAEADDRFRNGDIPAARELYLSAIEKIPEVQSSYRRLETIDSRVAEQGDGEFEEKIRSLEADLADARNELAAQRLELGRVKAEIRESANKLDRFRRYKDGYEAAESEGAGARSPEELRDLLRTKLLVKEILDSEPVRSEHPQLYGQLDLYLDALAEEKIQEGKAGAMEDVIAILEEFSREQEAQTLQGVWERYQAAYSRNLLLRLLEAVEELLE